jgi:hypothetical protein
MMMDSEKSDTPGSKQEGPLDDHRKRPDLSDAPLSLGNVSNMFNVSRLTLLFYERLGVMLRRRRVGQHLVYRSIDCDRLAFIIKARKLGLTARHPSGTPARDVSSCLISSTAAGGTCAIRWQSCETSMG